jgi:hypothetical protein
MLGSVSALDVDIDVPEITLSPKGLFAPLTRFRVDELLNTELADLAAEFETEIETDPEIEKYSDQPLLAEGFANAGAASAMSGLYRTQHGYKLFSAAYGLGMAFSMPGVDFLEELNSASFIEDEGDIYAGLAMHPRTRSSGKRQVRLLRHEKGYHHRGYFLQLPLGWRRRELPAHKAEVCSGRHREMARYRGSERILLPAKPCGNELYPG